MLIGIIGGFAVLSVGDGGRSRQMDVEARRVAALIRLCSDEAILQSRELGIRFEPAGYGFFVLESGSGKWKPVTGDKVLRQRKLPDGFEFELLLEDLPVDLRDEDHEGPHVFVLSSGELTPFELRLTALGSPMAYTVNADFVGRVTVTGATKE